MLWPFTTSHPSTKSPTSWAKQTWKGSRVRRRAWVSPFLPSTVRTVWRVLRGKPKRLKGLGCSPHELSCTRPGYHNLGTMQHHHPRVRMITLGDMSVQSSSSSWLTSHCNSSSQNEHSSSESHSGMSFSSHHSSSDADNHLQKHLFSAAKELTAEMGFNIPKEKLSYTYLTNDHHSFKTPVGPLSTQNCDWYSVTGMNGPANHTRPTNPQGHHNKCVITEKSHPSMSTEQYYRIKCWIENGSFGLESLPGHLGRPSAFMYLPITSLHS